MRALLLLSAICLLAGCTAPTKGPAAPPAESVTLYSPNEPQLAKPPAKYEVIGDIEVTELVDTPSDDIPESILRVVRSRASSMGANGVLIDGITSMAVAARRDGGEPTVIHRKLPMTITGKAIRVAESN